MLHRLRSANVILGAVGIGLGATPLAGLADEPRGPRVAAAWAAGPFETRVAFDRPLGPPLPLAFAAVSLEYDLRFASIEQWKREGQPDVSTSGRLGVANLRLIDEGRTLVLTTDPHPRAVLYTIAPRVEERGGAKGPRSSEVFPIRYDLSGVEAVWDEGKDAEAPRWSGWLPGLDLRESRRLTRGSVEHQQGEGFLSRPGRLTLNTLVRLPKGPATLLLQSNAPIQATLAGEEAEILDDHRARFKIDSHAEPVDLSIVIPTLAGGLPELQARYQTGPAGPLVSLERSRQLLPWSPAPPPPAAEPGNPPFDLLGGDSRRGEAVFFSDEARCSVCHTIRGRGGKLGPDLSQLSGRKVVELYREIADPSAVIHPEYQPYTLALKDGTVLVGTVRLEGTAELRVTDTSAKVTLVPRAQVEQIRPGSASIMPAGLAGSLGEAKLRDLLAFLAMRTAERTTPAGR